MEKKNVKLKPEIKLYLIIALVLILLIVIFIPKNYTKKYIIDNYQIEEKYNKKTKRYSLSIRLDDKVYEYNFENNYIGKKLIKSIETESNDDASCIINHMKKNKNIVLCIKDNQNIDYRLISDFDFTKYRNDRDSKYQKIDNIGVYDLMNKNYLIWNYNSFKYFEKDNNGSFKLFNDDYYNVSLATVIGNYLAIPNYESQYNFKEMILVNLKNKNKETWKLNYDVSFESYVLGTYKDSIYLVDKKNKVEYELNVKRKTMDIIGDENREGKILVNNKFENISLIKLVNNNLSFSYGYDQEFVIEGIKLFLKTNNTKMLVSNQGVNKIIYQTNDYVYYLVKDALYYYDFTYGEVKIMDDFEWNFNSVNKIFIY